MIVQKGYLATNIGHHYQVEVEEDHSFDSIYWIFISLEDCEGESMAEKAKYSIPITKSEYENLTEDVLRYYINHEFRRQIELLQIYILDIAQCEITREK